MTFASTVAPGNGETKTTYVVLIVDDVQENLLLLQDVLADSGYQTITTTNPQEALEIAQQSKVHVVIADAMMPKMDGLQLCKRLKGNPEGANIPFIIYTGNYVDKEDQDLARSVGVDRYVMKFEGTKSLVDAVNELTFLQYGPKIEEPVEPLIIDPFPQLDDQSFLERHHDLMVKKLEEKMVEQQMYSETLEEKNRELAISEKRYHSLFDNVGNAIIILDARQRRVVDLNNSAAIMMGRSVEQCLGVDRLPFFDASDHPMSIEEMMTADGLEANVRPSSGERIDVDISAASVELPNDSRVMLFIRDITEQKRLRGHAIQMEKMAVMGRLAASIAHEIRNPLAGVTLNLQYLSMKLPAESADRQSVDAALEGTRRIHQVIEDTLGLARVTPPTLYPESINAVIDRVLPYLRVPLREKSITLDAQFADDIPPVALDGGQIQQVLINLLQNAIDASPENSTITLSTNRLTRERNGQGPLSDAAEIIVRDQGIGLPPELLSHVFEGFHSTKEGGTGLGLMLSKFIIDRHQGSITIESAREGGTQVRILLPVAERKDTPDAKG